VKKNWLNQLKFLKNQPVQFGSDFISMKQKKPNRIQTEKNQKKPNRTEKTDPKPSQTEKTVCVLKPIFVLKTEPKRTEPNQKKQFAS